MIMIMIITATKHREVAGLQHQCEKTNT